MSGTQTQVTPNVTQFDPRLLSIEIEVQGQLVTFNQDFNIRVKITKYANSLQNTAHVDIFNVLPATRNYILTETSPFNLNRVPKVLNVKAGRQSTGLFLCYTGHIMTTDIKQPPDVQLTMKCGTGHFHKGRVGIRSGGANTKLSTVAAATASNLGLTLRNEAPDKAIANYTHTGNALDEVATLGKNGNCVAYVDDAHLILKPSRIALSGSQVNVSEDTGMVGVPEITEQGLKVRALFNPAVSLGGAVNVTSKLNPSANGVFVIYKLSYELDSREKNWYFIAECLKSAFL